MGCEPQNDEPHRRCSPFCFENWPAFPARCMAVLRLVLCRASVQSAHSRPHRPIAPPKARPDPREMRSPGHPGGETADRAVVWRAQLGALPHPTRLRPSIQPAHPPRSSTSVSCATTPRAPPTLDASPCARVLLTVVSAVRLLPTSASLAPWHAVSRSLLRAAWL